MDAITFILNEHKKIRKNFAAITKINLSISAKKRRFVTLSKFLDTHEKMEEKIWYPALKKNSKLRVTIKLLIAEEKKAAQVIKKMKATKDNEIWNETLSKLKKAVSNHAKDEETKLFPKVEKLIEEEDLIALGKKLKAFRSKHKVQLR